MKETKYLGTIVILISIIVFIVLYSISMEIASMSYSQCSSVMSCTIYQHIPVKSWLGFFMLAGLVFIGSSMVYGSTVKEKADSHRIIKKMNHIGNLTEEEKKLVNTVAKYDGTAFQSDLIKETGYSKVKVSRILDRLETKGLIERRRRGMANIIVMKQ
ncbi:MAG TPA: MarR family transcriptional regulator [archaeon]|nr:MarR family transcriptional regulator [archaeon]